MQMIASSHVNRFNTEAALVELFAEAERSRTLAPARTCFENPILEFECADGIADVVLFSVRQDWVSNKALALVPPTWAYALRALPYRKQFEERMFSEWCGVSLRTARGVLMCYEEHGFLTRSLVGGKWTKVKQPKPLVRSICAVEAKLRDWKKALLQAVRYKSFANQSWVLLDSIFIGPAIKNLELFEFRNIGLASIDSSGELKIHRTPLSEVPRSPMYYWQANAQIGAALYSKY